MERSLKEIEEAIIADLSISHTEIKGYSPEEKFLFVQRIMDNSRDYCCAKWGLDPEIVQTLFCLNLNGKAASQVSKDATHGRIFFNPKGVLNIINPLRLYKHALHEMRHIHQYILQDENSPERQRYYRSIENVSDANQWASSPAEIGADKFALKTVFGLLARGTFKGKINPFALETRKFVSYAINISYFHSQSVRKFSPHKVSKGIQEEMDDIQQTLLDSQNPTFVFDIRLVGLLSNMFPNQFRFKMPNMPGDQRHNLTNKVCQVIQAYKAERDLAAAEGKLNTTPVIQIRQSMVERLKAEDQAEEARKKAEEDLPVEQSKPETTESFLGRVVNKIKNKFKKDKEKTGDDPNGKGADVPPEQTLTDDQSNADPVVVGLDVAGGIQVVANPENVVVGGAGSDATQIQKQVNNLSQSAETIVGGASADLGAGIDMGGK